MEIKNFNKAIVPTEKELEELIGIYNLIYSDDEESMQLGESLYKHSLYIKRVKNYLCNLNYYHEITSKTAYHTVNTNVKFFTDSFFIAIIISLCTKDNNFLEKYYIKMGDISIPYNKLIIK